MKNKIRIIIVIFLLILGFVLLLYPFISNLVSKVWSSEVIKDYDETVNNLEEKKIEDELQLVRQYNESLVGTVILTEPFDESNPKYLDDEYYSLLNIIDEGTMGYIEIPSINVYLPIFHGTDNEILEKGVGHLKNTSLPIGGIGTHSVLSAHSGLPAAKLFTDLNKVKEEEIFFIKVLNKKLAYKVDKIKIVEPQEISDIEIDKDEDFVTLITCTPYGINSHRLLVRGRRIEYEEDEAIKVESTKEYNGYLRNSYLIVTIIVTIIVIYRVYKKRKKKQTYYSGNRNTLDL